MFTFFSLLLVQFHGDIIYKYGNIVKSIEVEATYNEKSLLWDWKIKNNEIKTDRTQLDVLGYWICTRENDENIYIQIDKIDLNELTITCSFSHRLFWTDSGSGTYKLDIKVADDNVYYCFQPVAEHENMFYISPKDGVYMPWYFDRYYYNRYLEFSSNESDISVITSHYTKQSYTVKQCQLAISDDTTRIYKTVLWKEWDYWSYQITKAAEFHYSDITDVWYLTNFGNVGSSEGWWHDIKGHYERDTYYGLYTLDIFSIDIKESKITLRYVFDSIYNDDLEFVEGKFDLRQNDDCLIVELKSSKNNDFTIEIWKNCVYRCDDRMKKKDNYQLERPIELLYAIANRYERVVSAEIQLNRWIASGKKSEEDIQKQTLKLEKELKKLEEAISMLEEYNAENNASWSYDYLLK